MDDDSYAVIDEAFKSAVREIDSGARLFDLTPLKQVVLVVMGAQGVIDNGGFQYFYEADWPNKPPYSLFINAFKEIGANKVADCIAESVELFPFPNPHLAVDARNVFLDSQGEGSQFEILADRVMELHEDTMSKLAAYIRKHQPAEG